MKNVLGRIWKMLRPWVPWIIVVALLYLLVTSINPLALWKAAGKIQWFYAVPMAGAFLLYLELRAARWHLLLKPLRAPNSLLDSLLLFTGAQAAVLVPAGQFLLPVLQKSQHGTLIRRSAATVMIQELVFGVFLIPAALPDLPLYHQAGWLLLIAFLMSFLAGVGLLLERVANLGLRIMRKIPILHKFVPEFEELRKHIVLVAYTKEAVVGSVLDLAGLVAMGTAFYIALVALGAHVGWIGALATYAFGASAGTISALPGGLGANEDISTLMLTRLGMAAGPAGAATLFFRVVTLVLGTGVGWLVLFVFRRRFRVDPSLKGLVEAVRRGEEETETRREPALPAEGPFDQPAREEELHEKQSQGQGQVAS
jgi:uncharacterized protein (TIRG00374 family)